MKVPQLKRKLEVKKYHSFELKDEFSWVHQKDILSVLKDSSKLNPEVKKYLKDENAYTKYQMQDTEKFQKKLFQEIKGRIKLDDESLHFFYRKDGWEYWTKTTKENNYSSKYNIHISIYSNENTTIKKKVRSKKISQF